MPSRRHQEKPSQSIVRNLTVSSYCIPTAGPESDGTLEWDSTTLVLVELEAGGCTGIGYTYGDQSTAILIDTLLRTEIVGKNCFDIPSIWEKMNARVRNVGRSGIASMAIAAVDIALWDLKAKLFGISVVALIGAVRSQIEIYGSGGFTSYSDSELQDQLSEWVTQGIERVKIKVGRSPEQDRKRVALARKVIGDQVELFVDANGTYTLKQALQLSTYYAESDVVWFEEPVSSDDLKGLAFIRNHVSSGMNITAGEYGYDLDYFRRMLQEESIDILQIDATRCAGLTGFLKAATLCESFHIPLSAHTAPQLHAHVCCCVKMACHVEYFHDHVRIENMLFEGALQPIVGCLVPDPSRLGFGLEFKRQDAKKFAV